MSRLARWCFRHRRLVLAGWFVLLLALGVGALTGRGEFSNNFQLADSESQDGFDFLRDHFPEYYGDPLMVPIRAEAGLDDPKVRSALESFFDRVERLDGVRDVVSPYEDLLALPNEDRTAAIAQIRMASFGPDVDVAVVRDIIDLAEATGDRAGIEVHVGGPTTLFAEMELASWREGAGLVLALIVLLITFGSVVAAGLPVLMALVGLGVSLSGMLLLTHVMDVFSFAPAMAAMIGLGVGIDYALFIVVRYRESLRAGLEPEDAVAAALDTSGRAVVFAGVTVIISLLGMLLMGLSIMVGMAVSSSLAVGTTVLAAVTLLPAVLGFVGRGIDRGSVGHHDAVPLERTRWHRWSRQVQRHPWLALVGALLVLGVLAAPVTSMRLGGFDFSSGPPDSSSHQAYELITDEFGVGFNGPLLLVAPTDPGDRDVDADLARVNRAVADTDGVALAAPAIRNEDGTAMAMFIIPDTAPHVTDTQDLVDHLRDDVLPRATRGTGLEVKVSGATALFVDMTELLSRRLPVFIGSVLVLSFLLLMVVFRSILVPAKAAVMNLLSIGAAYGVVVAVFQWGWGADLIGLDHTAPIMAFVPMMLFAILFGLSMDYEVFLLSRIREEYDRTGDNATAVADGLAATARVITAAAAIMVAVFMSFVAGDDVIVKTFGLGLAVAVLVDATVVRMVLVPATMELLGRANWWFPRWLDRILPTLRLETPVAGATGGARPEADDERATGGGTPGTAEDETGDRTGVGVS